MRHLFVMHLTVVLVAFLPIGNCEFNSFRQLELDDKDFLERIDRSDDYLDDSDIKFQDQESSENSIASPYKYHFNVVDEEEQVYQQQKQQRENGVSLSLKFWIINYGYGMYSSL